MMKKQMQTSHVTLFFRKPHATGNFSIESSFMQMLQNFPEHSAFTLSTYTLKNYSRGFIARMRGCIESFQQGTDINHITGDIHYITLVLPAKRTLLTIHDCGFMRHPNRFAQQILKFFWLSLPVKHCGYISTVSEATRREIISYTRCDPDKVIVIPTLISTAYKKHARVFNTARPRVLHIGMAPNKNFERHVAALAGLPCELHIIGQLKPEQITLLKTHGIDYQAQCNLSHEEMIQAYKDSDIMLFASTLEGFGMPIIEAQATGRVVVTSNISSMPEIAGSGACLVDPFSVASIQQGLQRVIEDTDYRNALIQSGFDNAKRFSPAAIAKQYESLYQRIRDNATQ